MCDHLQRCLSLIFDIVSTLGWPESNLGLFHLGLSLQNTSYTKGGCMFSKGITLAIQNSYQLGDDCWLGRWYTQQETFIVICMHVCGVVGHAQHGSLNMIPVAVALNALNICTIYHVYMTIYPVEICFFIAEIPKAVLCTGQEFSQILPDTICE